MRKIIKRKIHISTHKRDLIDFINDEFYSHDKHNAFLEFTMKSLPTDNIIALFYFQKTKRYVETKAFVDGDKFTIEFDTSLINTDETVLGFIYFEKVAQSADVHRFSFGVRVSEIDKLHDIPIEEAKTKRVVAIEDIVTKAELDELFKRIEKNGGTYNDTEIRSSITSISERVQTLENKPDNDTRYDDSDVKNRLSTLESNSSRYLTEHQSLSDYALKSELYNDSALSDRVTRLEQKPAVDTSGLATKEELQEVRNAQPQIDKSDLVTKEELEAKGYLTAHQNLEEYAKKSEIPERYNDSSLVERVTSLESKAIANKPYDDKPLLDKINAIEEQFRNASNLYLTSHQSLEHLVTKQELDGKGYLTQHQDISGLVTRDELNQKGYLTNHQDLSEYAKKTELYNDTALKERVVALENKAPVDLSHLVTRDELDGKHYLTEHQSLANYALKSEVPQAYNDTDLKERVTSLEAKALANGAYDDSNLRTRIHALETKEDKDTVYDDAEVQRRLSVLEAKPDVQVDRLVTKQELEAKGYLTNHQDVSGLATNSKVEAVEQRVQVLENKPDVDLSHVVTKEELASKNYLTNHQSLDGYVTKSELEQAGYIKEHQSLTDYAKKSELPAPYNDSALVSRINALEVKTDNDTVYNDTEVKQRLTALESRPTGQSEMRGTGMPNGVVEAPIGATYIDTAKTNGALKWIKTTDGGNEGWKVVEGDTGWVLCWQEDKGNNKNRMYFRRINDVVHVKFEPKISDNVNAHEYNLILDTGGSDISGKLSIQGFQSVDNIVQTIFKRTMDIPAETYSAENSEASQGCGAVCLHYVYNNDSKRELELHIATSQFSSDENHVNPFSYLTEDEWPTEFPTL